MEREALQAARGTGPTPSTAAASGTKRCRLARPLRKEPRCTWLAIRKLVATGLTLDRYRREEKQRAALWPTESLDGDPECLWISESIMEIVRVARRIGPTPLSVLLTGETGTGKEMLARTIHQASDRADKMLLAFNCTAVPRDMLESQLFGYRRGAFTGAELRSPGSSAPRREARSSSTRSPTCRSSCSRSSFASSRPMKSTRSASRNP